VNATLGWLPGGPHYLIPTLIAAWWTLCFLVSTGTGAYSLPPALEARRRLIRIRKNGVARVEADRDVRLAVTRLVVSPPALGLGIWALVLPSQPETTTALLAGAVLTALATNYTAQGLLDARDRLRQLRMLG
jgi:hypothetical protein